MGKESRLKPKDNGTRLSYPNGDRKLYVKDACPAGCDEVVWHLALFYRDIAAGLDWPAEGMPILYQEIYEKVLTDPLAAGILESRQDNTLLDVLEKIVERFFDDYNSNYPPRINDFINSFSELKAVVTDGLISEDLKVSGVRTAQQLPAAKEDRRSGWDKTRAVIVNAVTDEQEAWAAAKAFAREILEGD